MDGRASVQQRESTVPLSEMATGVPGLGLGHLVESYCGYSQRSTHPISRREAAAPRVVLVIGFGDPLWISGVSSPGRWQRKSAFVVGLGQGATLTRLGGRQVGLEARLTPLGAFQLLGVPMHELTDRVVDLADLKAPVGAELTEQLAETPGWKARFDLLDEVLARAADRGPKPQPELVAAWRRLEGSGGNLAISELIADTGWSRRRLAERFRAQIGLTPKPAARIVRFGRALELLTSHGRQSLASIALSCGYFDQAHLNRDFRIFAGCTPSEYLAAKLGDVPGTGLHPAGARTFVQDAPDATQ